MPERAHTPPGYTDDRPKEKRRTSQFTAGSGHVCLRPNSAAKIQENSKRANAASKKIGRPATSTAKARGLRPRSEPSLCSGTFSGGQDVAPPPHGSRLFLFLGCWRFRCFRLSSSCPRAVARPLRKRRGGGGATGRRPVQPPLPFSRAKPPGAEGRGSPGARRVPRQRGAKGGDSPETRAGPSKLMAPNFTACPIGAPRNLKTLAGNPASVFNQCLSIFQWGSINPR